MKVTQVDTFPDAIKLLDSEKCDVAILEHFLRIPNAKLASVAPDPGLYCHVLFKKQSDAAMVSKRLKWMKVVPQGSYDCLLADKLSFAEVVEMLQRLFNAELVSTDLSS